MEGIKIEEAQPFSVLFNAVREAHGFAQSGGVINAVKGLFEGRERKCRAGSQPDKEKCGIITLTLKPERLPQFIEVMACEGGCVTGPLYARR